MYKIFKIFFLLFLGQKILFAHETPRSIIFVDVGKNQIALEIYLSVNELKLAQPDLEERLNSVDNFETQNELTNYLKKHIYLVNSTFDKIPLEFNSYSLDLKDKEPYLLINASVNTLLIKNDFVIFCDAIIHKVINHKIFLSLRSDFNQGIFNKEVQTLEVFAHNKKSLMLTTNMNKNDGLFIMFKQGIEHILEGIDHLLFLLTLLIPIPMTLINNRWSIQKKSIYSSLIEAFKIVTAFAIGHTITLSLALFKLFDFSVKWIEVLVAITILITAFHILKPILNKYIFLLTLFFGLIHGLAFSEVLSIFNFDKESLIISLVGFSLGLEVIQLGLILLVIPLIILARYLPKIYNIIRVGSALGSIIISIVWIIQRLEN